MSERNQNILFFEDVLPKTGWGLYYKFMLGMACFSCFANSCAAMCIPLAVPLTSCESPITEVVLYEIFITFTVGRCIGGFLGSCLADIFGRKRLLMNSLIINFVTTFMAAFAYNYYMIIFAAFFLGSSLEHHQNVVKIHLAEILPMAKRGQYLSLCDLSGTFGYLLFGLIAVFFRSDSYVEHRVVDMRVTTWRMLFALAGGFNLLLACASALLEESPRYFLHARKDYLAVLTLKQFYAINKSTYGNSFDVRESDIRELIKDYGLHYQPENNGLSRPVLNVIVLIGKSVKLLYSKSFKNTTLLIFTLKSSLFLLNISNVNILLARYLTNGFPVTGTEIIYLDSFKNNSMCGSYKDNEILFFNFFLICSNIFMGQVFMIWFLDRIGRKISLLVGLLASGIAFNSLFLIEDGMSKMIFSSILMISFTVAMTAVSVLNIESFPTGLRGTSHGTTGFLGLLLCILLLRFYFFYSKWFVVIIGCLFILTSCATLLVKDLSKQAMVE